ncbi:hypothetical protein Tco_1186636 [Tanacetum coccineum]
MAYTSLRSSFSSDNEVYDDSFCSKSCRKNTENLNNKVIKLNEELSDCETDLYNYKIGLSQVEARLVEFEVNETKFCERIRVLERDVEIRDNKIKSLENELEELKKEKESIDHKLAGFVFNEYTVVPPPPSQVYSPPKNDLSWIGLPEFVDNTVTDYSRPTPSIDVPRDVSESVSFFEQRGSVGNVLSKPMIIFVKETGCPSVSKVNNTEKSRKPTVKYAEMYMSQRPRGNQRNWNNQKFQQLGSDFVMIKKACYSLKRDLELKNIKLRIILKRKKHEKREYGIDSKPVPPPPAQSIHPPMPEFVLTSLPVFADNTVTEHTRAIPRETSRSNMSRRVIKFVKESGCPNEIKINTTENTRKSTVKYAEMYRSQRPRGNQRNWNNQKS